MKFLYIASYIAINIYAQIVLKWRIRIHGTPPADRNGKILFALRLFTSGWILSIFAVSVVGIALWALALKYFPLAYAYMFTSISFVIVPVLSSLFFGEALSRNKIIGSLLIVAGICIVSIAGA